MTNVKDGGALPLRRCSISSPSVVYSSILGDIRLWVGPRIGHLPQLNAGMGQVALTKVKDGDASHEVHYDIEESTWLSRL